MQIVVRQDIAAPASHVFAEATDVATFERQAMRRGADVVRKDRLTMPGTGMGWAVAFTARGRRRQLAITIDRLEPPTLAAVLLDGGGLGGSMTADFLALSRTTTRLSVRIDIEGRTLATRLMLQALRLGHARLEARAAARLAWWSREVEARWRRQGGAGLRESGRP